ncbi:hypothetical protein [Geothrix paludis]|uniref:hypothetical protein n=1 Tax=Geothrix paludis TaxID=2922722 RepID=UPI001FACC3C0|nr:hypothetical protein [Geothrix paludis]
MKKPGFPRHTPDPEPPKRQPIPGPDLRERAHTSRSSSELRAAAPSPAVDGPEEWLADLDAEIRRLEAKEEETFLLGRLRRLASRLAKEVEALAILVHLEDELEALWAKLGSTPLDQQKSIRAEIEMIKDLRDRCETYLKSIRNS